MWNDILTHSFAVADSAFAFSRTIAAGAALVAEHLLAVLVDARLAYGALAIATKAAHNSCASALAVFDWRIVILKWMCSLLWLFNDKCLY
jgi:hypothetical protein